GIRDFHVTGVQTCALPIWLVDRVEAHDRHTVTDLVVAVGQRTVVEERVLADDDVPALRVLQAWRLEVLNDQRARNEGPLLWPLTETVLGPTGDQILVVDVLVVLVATLDVVGHVAVAALDL